MIYTTLKTTLLAWLNRPEVEQFVPTFIEMAESEMNRRLRVRRMIGRATATIDSEYGTQPSDFLGVKTFTLSGTPKVELQYLDPDAFNAQRIYEDNGGRPKFYTIEGREFRYLPVPSEEYTGSLTYWEKLDALSDTVPTNWIIADHPDAYVYGALSHAAAFLGGHPSGQAWRDAFDAQLSQITHSDRTEGLGATLQQRPGAGAYV